MVVGMRTAVRGLRRAGKRGANMLFTSKLSAPSLALALRLALSCGYVAWDRFFRVRVIPSRRCKFSRMNNKHTHTDFLALLLP